MDLDADRELIEFCRPPNSVTNTLMVEAPQSGELSLSMLGMHGAVYANYAINSADLLLAFGVRFDDRVTGKLTEFAKRRYRAHRHRPGGAR